MGVLIDASVLIGAERARVNWDELLGRGVELDEDEPVALAAITASELLHGVHRLKGVAQARAAFFVDTILDQIPVQPFDAGVARVHAMLSAERAGRGDGRHARLRHRHARPSQLPPHSGSLRPPLVGAAHPRQPALSGFPDALRT